MNINVARNGQQLGVFPLEEINRRLATGELLPADLAWHEGMAGWQPLHTIAGVHVPAGTALAPTAPPPGAAYPAAGYPGAAAYGAPAPPNYLVQSILVTLLCCLPLGIVSIIFAAQVDGKARAGDLAGAQAASNQAKRWSTIGAVAGLVVGLIYVVLGVTGAITNFR